MVPSHIGPPSPGKSRFIAPFSLSLSQQPSLAALRLLAQQTEAQDRAVASATRATKLSDVRYRNGLVSQLDLLDARRSELRNRRQALDVRSTQYQSTVVLIRALGGGWGDAGDTVKMASVQP